MRFPTWSLLVFPILAIVLIIMLPILAIAVPVSVGRDLGLDSRTKSKQLRRRRITWRSENEVQAIAAPDGYRQERQDLQTRGHDADAA